MAPTARTHRGHPPVKPELHNVLLRAPNWLGDCVLALPAVNAVRRALPNAHLVVMARQAVADLWRMTQVDRVLPFAFRPWLAGMRDRMAFARMLRGQHFDAALVLPNSFDAALVPLLARIPDRAGWPTDCRSLMLTRRIPKPPYLADTSQAQLYLHLVGQWLGHDVDARCDVRLRVPDDAAQRVRDACGATSPPVIGINPGATYGTAKCWLPDRYADVAIRAHRAFDARIILLGGPGDVAVCARVLAMIEHLTGGAALWCTNLAGATTLCDLAAWLEACTCLVTNDTGSMHVAAAVGTPVVAVFGPTDWKTTAPLGQHHALIRVPCDCAPCLKRTCPTDHRCMTAISADMVFDALAACVRSAGAAPES